MRRTSFRDADILVLTQAQINARFAPFSSTELIINTTAKQIKQGPGRWADCEMVMDLSGSGGVLRYKATVSQSGTNAPAATAFEDSLGGAWSRENAGVYRYTKKGAFAAGKVWLSVSPGYNAEEGIAFTIERGDDDTINLIVSNGEDNWLNNHMVLIEVHP
jgi:hypothetical protein